jgi:hypothetical protein
VGNDNITGVKEGAIEASREDKSYVSQDADRHAGGSQQTASEKSGAARGDSSEARPDLTTLERLGNPTKTI